MDLRREKKRAIMRYAGYVAGTLGVGGLSALLSRGGMEAFAHLKKPSFSPPGWVFPVAWTLLYILMAISAAMIARRRDEGIARRTIHVLGAALRQLLVVHLFLRLGTSAHGLFLAASAARSRRGDGDSVWKDPFRGRETEHSVPSVACFRRRVEYIGIHFKQVKRFRMARNWFAGQFFVKTCFS